MQGTNIGYIYVWDWDAGSGSQSEILFAQAVDELMHINNVDGLILDFRTNIGGWPGHANDGFKYLFNVDPTSNYSRAIRVPGNDHFLFNIMSPDPLEPFTPNSELFDRPIAVLTGPRCQSSGDYNAFRMRFHPMARFFGKKTACAYTDYNTTNVFNYSYYRYRVDNGCLYSNYNNEEYMIHKGFPVDEQIWLTRDGVANGQDDVVNRAIEWINNLVYPHDVLSDNTYYSPVEDTVNISTIIENPNSHQISARGYIHNLNDVLIDSVDLVKQSVNTLEEDWTGNLPAPSTEAYFKVSVTVFDQTNSDEFTLPNATRFTTVGPVTLDSLYVVDHTTYFTVKPFVKNHSTTQTITEASIKLICNDPWVTSISPDTMNLPDIQPGTIVNTTNSFTVNIDTSIFQDYFNFTVEVSSNIWHYWTDSMRVPPIITGADEELFVPLTYRLQQNFPNPFNPSTTIQYSIPHRSNVVIKVYDILGNEVKTLVNEEKDQGVYTINFDANNLASGLYLYRIQAGSFIDTKKMILLK